MPKSVVAIVKGTDPTAMVEEALSLLGGVSSLITPKSKVFLKTNTAHPNPPEQLNTNSPEMVTGCIKAFQKVFLFDIELPSYEGLYNVGGRLYVRFDHGREPLIWRWYRRLRHLFLRRFNV